MTIKLRENLEIELKEWSGRTKKTFINIFRNKGTNITEKEIYETLVLPYIEPNNIFLNSAEYQFILIELKKFNFKDEFEFQMKCTNCEEHFLVDTTLTDIMDYHPSSLTTVESDIVKFRNIPTQEVYNTVVSNYKDENKTYLQLLLSIEELNKNTSESMEQILEDVEDLSVKKYNIVEELFVKNNSQISLGLIIECPECSTEKTYKFDTIPNFFEDMLPAKK